MTTEKGKTPPQHACCRVPLRHKLRSTGPHANVLGVTWPKVPGLSFDVQRLVLNERRHQRSMRLCPPSRYFPIGLQRVRTLWLVRWLFDIAAVCVHTLSWINEGHRPLMDSRQRLRTPWLRDLRGSSHLGTEHW